MHATECLSVHAACRGGLCGTATSTAASAVWSSMPRCPTSLPTGTSAPACGCGTVRGTGDALVCAGRWQRAGGAVAACPSQPSVPLLPRTPHLGLTFTPRRRLRALDPGWQAAHFWHSGGHTAGQRRVAWPVSRLLAVLCHDVSRASSKPSQRTCAALAPTRVPHPPYAVHAVLSCLRRARRCTGARPARSVAAVGHRPGAACRARCLGGTHTHMHLSQVRAVVARCCVPLPAVGCAQGRVQRAHPQLLRQRLHRECGCQRQPGPARRARTVTADPARVQVLWLHDCLSIWRSVYFLGHLSILAIILVGAALPPRKPKRDVKPDPAAASAHTAADGVAAPAMVAAGGQPKKQN